MKLFFLIAHLYFVLAAFAASWSKEDQEIFRLRHEIEASEGLGVTFYDFLGTKHSANQDEINQAYRKKSRILHPDKAKRQFANERSPTGKLKQSEIKSKAKEANDRFARLGIVAKILRGPGRDRYNYFLKNGFPEWKGTDYYYARFRPGLGSVLFGLFIFVGGAGHWIVLYLSWKRQKDFVNKYVSTARNSVMGENIPGLEDVSGSTNSPAAEVQSINRRHRRMQDKDNKKEKKSKVKKLADTLPAPNSDTRGPRKRVVAENGKTLVVDSVGNVYLEHIGEDGESHELLLDPNELQEPHLSDTALIRLPLWIFSYICTWIWRHAPVIIIEPKIKPKIDEDTDVGNSSTGDNFERLENTQITVENGKARVNPKRRAQKKK